MAEGIRIKHKTMKAPQGSPGFMILAIRDKSERLKATDGSKLPDDYPYPACSVCNIPSPGHEGYKTRHIEIDTEGYAIVSSGILEGLAHHVDHGGFDIINTISNPPRQIIAMGADGNFTRTVVHKVPRQIITKG